MATVKRAREMLRSKHRTRPVFQSREERFRHYAEKRMSRLLDEYRLLTHLDNRTLYEATPEQIAEMTQVLEHMNQELQQRLAVHLRPRRAREEAAPDQDSEPQKRVSGFRFRN